MTPQQLHRILPLAKGQADLFAPYLIEAMARYQINTPARQASFLAQIGHESAHLNRTSENLVYSPERLLAVWPARFPTLSSTAGYARNAPALANKVYGGRMGNDDEKSGDGWRYRGRGLLQITGKSNYARCGTGIGYNLLDHPELMETPKLASLSAAWYWAQHGLNELADLGDQERVSKKINMGDANARGVPHGLAQRLALFDLASKVLNPTPKV